MSRSNPQFTPSRLQFLNFFQWFGCCCALGFVLLLYFYSPASWPEQALNLTTGFFALLLALLLFQFNLAPAGGTVALSLGVYLLFVLWCYVRAAAAPLRYEAWPWFEMFLLGGWIYAIGAILFRPVAELDVAQTPPSVQSAAASRAPHKAGRAQRSIAQSRVARLPALDAERLARLVLGFLALLALIAALDAIHQVFWRFDAARVELDATIRAQGRTFQNDALLFALSEKRASGRFGNPNVFCAYLALLLPAIFALLAALERPRPRLAAAAVLALVLYAAALSHSRGGMLCVFLALILSLALLGKKTLYELRLPLLSAAGLALALCLFVRPASAPQQDLPGMEVLTADARHTQALVKGNGTNGTIGTNGTTGLQANAANAPKTEHKTGLNPSTSQLSTSSISSRSSRSSMSSISSIESIPSAPTTQSATPAGPGGGIIARLFSSGTIRERLYYWQSAGAMIRQAPLSGNGLGSFVLLYQKYKLPEAHEVRDAHQLYLQLWAETGLIGLALFLAWLFTIILALRRARHLLRAPSAAQALLPSALLAALAVFLLDALFDLSYIPSFRQYFYTLCLLLGIAVGALETALQNAASAPSERRSPWPAASVPLVFVALFLLPGWRAIIQPSRAAARAQYAKLLADAGRFDDAYAMLRRAMALTPDDPEIYRQLSNLRRNSGDLRGALEHIGQAIERAPQFAGYHAERGRLQRAAGEFVDAERAFERAIALYPLNAEYHEELSRVYQAQRQWPLAVLEAQEALRVSYAEFKPKRLERLAEIHLAAGAPQRAREALCEALKLAPPQYQPRYRRLLRELTLPQQK